MSQELKTSILPSFQSFFIPLKRHTAFLKNKVDYLLTFIKKNISVMLLQGLKPAWLDEAYLKSKNSHNVSLVPVQSVV